MIKALRAIRNGFTGAPKPLQNIVIFQFIPGKEFCEFDPAIVERELATKWHEEVFERKLMTMLAPIHVERLWAAFRQK